MNEHKFIALDDVEVAADSRSVKGYASVFDGVDSYGDTIVKGAYSASIRAAGNRGIPMLHQHDPDRVIGRWMLLQEDEKGLAVEGTLTPDHSLANDIYASLRAGHVDGFSIGFRIPPGGSSERADGVRVLKKIDLREISIVTFPADSAARATAVKASDQTEREFERLLLRVMRDAGVEFSRSEAITLMRDGYQGLIAKRDAGGGDETSGFQKSLLEAIRHAKG